MDTMTFTGTLVVMSCGECDINFAIPGTFISARHRDHKTFYCPRGHSRWFPHESDLEKAERLRKQAQVRATWLSDQLGATQRSLAAQKGAKTRLKNRIAAGVCPCCNRQFQNVLRHMAGQHPEFTKHTED